MGHYDDQTRQQLRKAEDELAQRRQAEQRIRELHREYRSVYDEGDDRSCAHCNHFGGYAVPWPCPTIATLGAS